MATLGAFSAMPVDTEGAQSLASTRVAGESHHPGPPRVMHAGEKLVDPLTPDYRDDGAPDGRDTLAPRVPDPQRDPEEYAADAFTWRVVDTPDDSDVTGFYSNADEYDYGGNVEEFDPDVPGTYTLELDAPDGTHELSVRVFPEPPAGAGGPPTVNVSTSVEDGEFVVEIEPRPAPNSEVPAADLNVEFLPDDRDSLGSGDITVDGRVATVAMDAVDELSRVHAVAAADQHSMIETVELDPDAGTASRPNEPPEWIEDARMYEIFVRSFGSGPGEADFEYLTENVDYIDSLGTDVVWLTPIVEATSHREDNPPGGPHGYDTLNYFETADALGSIEEFEAFVDACHERNIKVCFDIVINHVDIQHRFFEDADASGESSKYFEWFERQADGSPNNYFGWSDLMNINFQNVALREHILSVVDFWVDKVDGFRADIAYGVPHDFWKEVRARVRAQDSEFFLLDEAIPYGRDFSEQEFDVHFDDGLHSTLVDVGRGGTPATAIFEAVAERRNRGVPDDTVFLQYIENHDTERYLDDEAITLETERAAAAATYTLPGIPMLYYGTERAIAEYSEPRLEERGHFRSFMNWDDYDEDHLAFYRSLSEARDSLPALQHGADFAGAYFDADSEQVVAYGRESDEQSVVVVLNFGEGTEQVALRGPVSSTDLLTGTDLGVETDDETTTVAVDAVAILETPSLSGLGTHVAGVEDQTGDDDGPGNYTYPTDEDYADGAFDLTSVDIYESETDYQLRVTVDGPVENPRDYDGGFSVQHVQCYVRDPTDPGGGQTAREGLTAALANNYHYRIVGDGENGARVETPDGETIATGEVFASPSTHSIRLDVPKQAIPGGLAEKEIAPLLLGYDPEATGNVVQVGESAGENQFGGATGEEDPQVIDMLTPAGEDQSAVLGGEGVARIPYVMFGNPIDGELVEQWDDPTGDDAGPGSYTYPDDDNFEDGVLDISSFAIYDTGSRYRFVYELAGDLTNPGSGEHGFSTQLPQVYVRNEAADQPTATAGREGTNVAFAEPYHVRLHVEGYEGNSVVENGAGEVVTDDVRVAGYGSLDAITASIPKSAVGGSLDTAAIAPLLCSLDPEGPGRVRQVAPSATPQEFGGGSTGDDPAVIDMVTPEGAAQSDALESGDSVPYLSLAGFSGDRLYSWTDEIGDDHGPGSYTYPTSDQIAEDVYDITKVELYRTSDRYRFVYYMGGPIDNPFSADSGFSVQHLQVYVRVDGSDSTAGVEARKGVNAKFAQPYHYRIAVNGYGLQTVEKPNGDVVTDDVSAEPYPDMGAIAFDLPASAIDGDVEDMQFAPLLMGDDGFGQGQIRSVAAEQQEWTFGGGRDDEMNPNVIDMITPESVSQSEALSYTADEQARIPYVPERERDPGTPTAVAGGDQTVFATTEVTLDGSGSSDPEEQDLTYEWAQTTGPDVDLSDAETAQSTFTAPEVEEETELGFELSVTDPDDNSATASTTVTVRPQSANDAPVASVAQGDRTVDPGQAVLLDGATSTDPNDGTLSFQWEQTGGPEVELTGADTSAAGFTAPEPDEETTMEFALTVADGQGKTDTATVEITVPGSGGGEGSSDTGSGFGPGFGVVSAVLGTAGGAAYAGKRLLDDDSDETNDAT